MNNTQASYSPLNQTQGRLRTDTECKLILKCFRMWKHYLKMRRLRQQEKEQMVKSLVTAIFFNESCLKTRSFISLIRHKMIQKRNRRAFKLIKNKVYRNLEIFVLN